MILSRLLPSLSALAIGLGLAASSAPAEATSWGVSIGGYGSGYHYGVSYRDRGRHHRGHWRGSLGHGYGYGAPFYRAPVFYGGPYHRGYGGYYAPVYYPRATVIHGGYYQPVVVRSHAPRRHDGQVRYYDHRPAPRRGYDRAGYGDQYRPASVSRQYDYDEVHVEAAETWVDESEGYQAYPDDSPGRIERR